MKTNQILLTLIYPLALFLIFAIIRYVIYFQLGLNPFIPDKYVKVRVFLSGPGLVIIGAILILFYKNLTHRLFGYFFGLAGLILMIIIIKTIIEK